MKPNFSILFCDDIRHEIGGKVSLMGIYGTHLLVPSLPIEISRLVIHFSIELPVNMKPNSIKVNILLNGKHHASIELASIGYNEKLAQETLHHRIIGGTDLNDIEIEEKTNLEASVELDGEFVYNTKLIIDTKMHYNEEHALIE
ncbi:DUF6941 family protein [Rheinheimera sp. MMS21-TC3]|uniref:DUF6941 family protein n=1 Tax=Rheinheimera sp. MMS21-TC3 TaxID=3072790 RepID=UPI0028C46CE7|nr:hypothetical protein [Rheinheimera sp. MMS21-TC3]WNO60859.1 hypothetical protein RDV63_07820 [Rheinheimera sp. MMS21-TC3]